MQSKSKIVAVLGSTGSIGCNTLSVIDNLNKNGYGIKVEYLTTNSRTDLLLQQISKHSPSAVVIQDKESCNKFKTEHHSIETEVLCGREGLMEIAKRDNYNFLVNALVGFSGLEPTLAAINSGLDVALANKETLVAAGDLVTSILKKNKTHLYPIDSEHSAILQCIAGENAESVDKLILTASGGPFLYRKSEEIKNISVKDALAHPNWKMGNKITIDSATMMNKGLEVIEAKWLFNMSVDKIQVLIHPQSIIHSMVEFSDGSIKAQLGLPDMKIPIQYSLTYPERVLSDYARIDFTKLKNLTFEEPDLDKYKCLKIAINSIKEEGTYPTVMNAANEIAVELFLKKKISFFEIPEIIERELQSHNNSFDLTLENILHTDSLTRNNILQRYQ